MDDVFCKIIRGEIPTDFVLRTDELVVFRDINPSAPVHLLVVPIRHCEGIGDAKEDILGKLLKVAHRVAQEAGLQNGYRIIVNDGVDGGKIVPHLHLHVLGGKKFL